MYKKITENVENISLLPDTPALSPTELKKEFDKGNKIIKNNFNEFIDELNTNETQQQETNKKINNLTIRQYQLTQKTSSLALNTWADCCNDFTTDELPAGTYLILMHFSVICSSTTGSGSFRPTIDDAEVNSRMRCSIPTRDGRVTTGTAIAYVTFEEASTHVINGQFFTGSTVKMEGSVICEFIKLCDYNEEVSS